MAKALAKVKGLVERDGRWQYDFTYRGQRHVETFDTRAAALDAMTVLRGQLKDARLADAYGVGNGSKPKVITVGAFYKDSFLPWLKGKNTNTAKNDRCAVGLFVKGHHNRLLGDITPAMLEKWSADRLDKGKKKITVAGDLRRLGRFFKLALRDAGLRANPVLDVDKPKAELHRPRHLEPGEEKCFWDALPSDLYRSLFKVTLYTGLRRNEVLHLKVGDVNLAKSELSIVQEKTGHPKTIPLIPEAVVVLREAIPAGAADDAYVFPGVRGATISKTQWFSAFDQARRKCKIARLRPHDLRHTLGQRLADAGVRNEIIGPILGHKPPYRSTMIYTQGREDKQAMVAAMAGFSKTLK